MTKDNEDALRCADRLERSAGSVTKLDNLLGLPQAKHGRVDRDKNAAAHLRRLVAENEALNHYRKVYGEVSAILACTAEMPPPSDDDEITVLRLKALVHDFEVYVDSCAAKADRIDRLGEAVVKLRSENEAKDALLRQAVEALKTGQIRAVSEWEVRDVTPKIVREAIAAIRQHLEGKA